ncbi:MAG: phosphoserine phosphatase SerB [Leptospirales bacterium]
MPHIHIPNDSSCRVCDAIKSENVLLHITGFDYPGVLSKLTNILKDWDIPLLDVQQTTSLGQLSLSMLINVPAHVGLGLLKGISSTARETNMNLDFFVLQEGELVRDESRKSFALTVLSPKFSIASFHALAEALGEGDINIERMNRLAQGNIQAIEFILGVQKDHTDLASLKRLLFRVAFKNNFDLAIQPENLYRRSKRLIVMDMDSTLIQQEVIDELAEVAGVKDKVSDITLRAMQGELDFSESLRERVGLLKGLPTTALKQVLNKIELTPGVDVLLKVLKKMGFKIAIVSGGFLYFTEHLRERLGLDYSFANQFEIEDDKLTGEIKGEIVDRSKKAEILKELARQEKIPLDQTVAIGDGANDLDMLEAAGLGIAFNAKPTVRDQARAFISQPGLDSVLYLLGVSQKELTEMQDQ